MLLSDVDPYLDPIAYPRKLRAAFLFEARYVCNFFVRRFAAIKARSRRMSRICVKGCPEADDSVRVDKRKVGVVTVPFELAEYRELKRGQRHELFLGMLMEGLRKCAAIDNQFPLAEMEKTAVEFRQGGYKNEWVCRSKWLRPGMIRACLHCSLDWRRFRLTLVLHRKGQEIFRRKILEELPEEALFARRFKDVVMTKDAIVVTGINSNKPIYSIKMSTLPE
jgi:hypothetical protein